MTIRPLTPISCDGSPRKSNEMQQIGKHEKMVEVARIQAMAAEK
jgi:hypothetical protein